MCPTLASNRHHTPSARSSSFFNGRQGLMLLNSAPRSLAIIYLPDHSSLTFNLITHTHSPLVHPHPTHPLAVFRGFLLAIIPVFGNLFLIALISYFPQTLALFQLFAHIFVPFKFSATKFETRRLRAFCLCAGLNALLCSLSF